MPTSSSIGACACCGSSSSSGGGGCACEDYCEWLWYGEVQGQEHWTLLRCCCCGCAQCADYPIGHPLYCKLENTTGACDPCCPAPTEPGPYNGFIGQFPCG